MSLLKFGMLDMRILIFKTLKFTKKQPSESMLMAHLFFCCC